LPIHRARGRIFSRKDWQIGDDCDGVEGVAKSKICKARFGKCRLTITPPEFSKFCERRIFRKKIAVEDPLDPLSKTGECVPFPGAHQDWIGPHVVGMEALLHQVQAVGVVVMTSSVEIGSLSWLYE
jgi:hypothetical protein